MSLDDLAERVQRVVGDRYQIETGSGAPPPAPSRWQWFMATTRNSEQKVVIKAVRNDDEHVARRFELEVGAVDSPPGWMGVREVGHPRILSILTRGHGEGVLYYVTPRLSEGSLRTRLEHEGLLSVGDAVRILGEVAEGLSSLHARGVVHGHLKPENVLFEHGHVVLAEWFEGFLSGPLPDDIPYESPESLQGRRLDGRSDVYSLATVGFEMLAGRRPFVGERMEVMWGIVRGLPPLLSTLRTDVPRAVDEVLARALSKVPENRFPDAASFRAALVAATRA